MPRAGGLFIYQQNRGPDWPGENIRVLNNDFTFLGSHGEASVFHQGGVLGENEFFTLTDIFFDGNTYSGDASKHWRWLGGKTFAEWQALGQDPTGSLVAPILPPSTGDGGLR